MSTGQTLLYNNIFPKHRERLGRKLSDLVQVSGCTLCVGPLWARLQQDKLQHCGGDEGNCGVCLVGVSSLEDKVVLGMHGPCLTVILSLLGPERLLQSDVTSIRAAGQLRRIASTGGA